MPTYLFRDRKKKVNIYALSDPDNGEVFYVGKTERKISERLNQHISDSRSNPDKKLSKQILNIITRGKRPRAELIEIVDRDVWEDAEIFWIDLFKKKGAKLLNTLKGGGGW